VRSQIRRSDIEMEFLVLSRMMGIALRLDKMAGGYRVELADGSRYISPRLPARAMYDWLCAGVAVAGEFERQRNAT